MSNLLFRCGRVLGAVLLLATLSTALARAHPMGNFTVNHYSGLTLAPGALRLHYVLDMAELPTITERQDMDTDGNGDITPAEIDAYLARRLPDWLSRLTATADGKALTWRPRAKRLEFTAGVANLPVMRVELDADAALPPGRHAIAYEDTNYGARTGWKEVVLAVEKGVARPTGTDMLKDTSRALRAYPEDQLDTPLQVSHAAFTADIPAASVAKGAHSAPPKTAAKRGPKPAPKAAVVERPEPAGAPAPVSAPAASAAAPSAPQPQGAKPETAAPKPGADTAPSAPAPVTPPAAAAVDTPVVTPSGAAPAPPAGITPETRAPMSGSSSRWSKAFHDLVTQKALSPGAVAVALFIAFFLGALHALQPGHGKTLVAAYLVGQRGTARHAALLGLTVTVSHTFGVFVLGAVALYASRYILPQDLFPWMGFASGALIAALGLGMLIGRLRGATGHAHAHGHDHHHHAPELAAAHVHHHDHRHGDDVHHHDHPHGDDHAHSHGHHHDHDHPHEHTHDHAHDHPHPHDHHHGPLTHSHGPFGEHTHEVPDHISLKSLLALGISGGIVPCWDALIVLLGAISLRRVGFGLLLIVAFSAGLAATLTAAGLAVVWGQKRFGMSRLSPERVRAVSMASHAVIIGIGVFIAWQSLAAAGIV